MKLLHRERDMKRIEQQTRERDAMIKTLSGRGGQLGLVGAVGLVGLAGVAQLAGWQEWWRWQGLRG